MPEEIHRVFLKQHIHKGGIADERARDPEKSTGFTITSLTKKLL
ncbi:MAG: hypothetical protein UW01_C0021G0002 [Candidatus Nomurabacteria bacterium GW2011_GWA2_43_66]|nr:MAG: hypothetical protein UW01_C0021G0002 [Candidatus Nomurabacteria bacterium GW2011_GWA2_43_66]